MYMKKKKIISLKINLLKLLKMIFQEDFLSFYNVLLTSHQAYFTQEAVDAITLTTLNNIKDFVEGKELVNEVPQNQ